MDSVRTLLTAAQTDLRVDEAALKRRVSLACASWRVDREEAARSSSAFLEAASAAAASAHSLRAVETSLTQERTRRHALTLQLVVAAAKHSAAVKAAAASGAAASAQLSSLESDLLRARGEAQASAAAAQAARGDAQASSAAAQAARDREAAPRRSRRSS